MMPYNTKEYVSRFNSEELAQLKRAYEKCCDLLGGPPINADVRDMVASFVLRTCEDNGFDAVLAAQQAYEIIEMLKVNPNSMHSCPPDDR